ncbi:BCCT family transporter [Oceanobacillus longus]|uniref:BCCT family transporter n=1 Tax=Oceanobacillus longus TaxID=930120 RepID=A0ABV8H4G1_9BACI
MAWSPYVGTFIARVSEGRTLREFPIAVLLVPSLVNFLWFTLIGILSTMPFSIIASILTIILIVVFFITSADSATFVLSMHSTNGSLNPAKRFKFVWGIVLSLTAINLLYSGGLQAVQNVMIIAAFPFSIILLLMVCSLLKSLRLEKVNGKQKK